MSEKNNIKTKIEKLNAIVAKMSDEELSLDESLELYKQGKAIVEELNKLLENTKEVVEKVIMND